MQTNKCFVIPHLMRNLLVNYKIPAFAGMTGHIGIIRYITGHSYNIFNPGTKTV